MHNDEKLALVAAPFLAGLLAAVGRLVYRRAAPALRGFRVRRRLGVPVSLEALRALPRDAVVTVEGTLGGERNDGVLSYHPRAVAGRVEANVHAFTRASEAALWIEVEGERIALEPPLQVVSGTSALEGSRDAARWEGPPASVEKGEVHYVARGVAAGERVRARGRLDFEARSGEDAQGAGYRDAARAYPLRPELDPAWPARPIPLATAGTPPPLGWMPAYMVVALGLVAGAVLVVVSFVVMGVTRSAWSSDRPRCAKEADALVDRGEPEAALALRCPDLESRARAYWLLGDPVRASDAWFEAAKAGIWVPPTVSEAQAHTIAGRPDQAQYLVSRMSAIARTPWEKAELDCIGAGFGRRAGDPAAAHALHALEEAGGKWSSECQAVRGDFGYRIAEMPLAALYDAERSGRPGRRVFPDPHNLVGRRAAWDDLRPRAVELAIEASILQQCALARADDKVSCDHHAADVALFLALMGEREDAAAHLDLFDPGDARARALVEHVFSDPPDAVPPPCVSCGIFSLAENVAERRAQTRRTGDQALEARLAPVAERLAAIVLQRDGAPEIFALEQLCVRQGCNRR